MNPNCLHKIVSKIMPALAKRVFIVWDRDTTNKKDIGENGTFRGISKKYRAKY
jgi:hypothetical protein